jgi:putative nucleotidyltransferase with HDIG domain
VGTVPKYLHLQRRRFCAVPVSYDQGLALLRRHGLHDTLMRHSRGVAAFARELAERIALRHPEFGVDSDRVEVAALLHDIGRSRPGDHEANSVAILREEGLPELATIAMHGSYYEIMKLRGSEDVSLLPRSVENKIVAYADARFRLEPVTLQQRFDDILERRTGDPEKVRAVRMAMPRMQELERELMDLAGGSQSVG